LAVALSPRNADRGVSEACLTTTPAIGSAPHTDKAEFVRELDQCHDLTNWRTEADGGLPSFEQIMSSKSQQSERTISAPLPSPASAKRPLNRVESVVLGPDEDVEWIWTHTLDGSSYVSGYSIVKSGLDGAMPHTSRPKR
jgi:hypothetical protein